MKTIVIGMLLGIIVVIGWNIPDEPHTYEQAIRMLMMGVVGMCVLFCCFFWNGKRVLNSNNREDKTHKEYD